MSYLLSLECATNCADSDVGNGICNEECDVPTCNYDNGDCAVLSADHSSETTYLSSDDTYYSSQASRSSDETYNG